MNLTPRELPNNFDESREHEKDPPNPRDVIRQTKSLIVAPIGDSPSRDREIRRSWDSLQDR